MLELIVYRVIVRLHIYIFLHYNVLHLEWNFGQVTQWVILEAKYIGIVYNNLTGAKIISITSYLDFSWWCASTSSLRFAASSAILQGKNENDDLHNLIVWEILSRENS